MSVHKKVFENFRAIRNPLCDLAEAAQLIAIAFAMLDFKHSVLGRQASQFRRQEHVTNQASQMMAFPVSCREEIVNYSSVVRSVPFCSLDPAVHGFEQKAESPAVERQ